MTDATPKLIPAAPPPLQAGDLVFTCTSRAARVLRVDSKLLEVTCEYLDDHHELVSLRARHLRRCEGDP